MALVGGKEAFEVVYVDKYGRSIGHNDLSATTARSARTETARKLAVALDNRATRGDSLVCGGYFRKKA